MAQCLSVLVLGINTRLDSGLLEMTKARWDALETIGDESPYVSTFRSVLRECGPRLGESLEEVDFDYLCDKTVHLFVPRFYENLFKLKRQSININLCKKIKY